MTYLNCHPRMLHQTSLYQCRLNLWPRTSPPNPATPILQPRGIFPLSQTPGQNLATQRRHTLLTRPTVCLKGIRRFMTHLARVRLENSASTNPPVPVDHAPPAGSLRTSSPSPSYSLLTKHTQPRQPRNNHNPPIHQSLYIQIKSTLTLTRVSLRPLTPTVSRLTQTLPAPSLQPHLQVGLTQPRLARAVPPRTQPALPRAQPAPPPDASACSAGSEGSRPGVRSPSLPASSRTSATG